MSNNLSHLTPQIPSLGWKQFLTARDEMLAAYDRARKHSSKRAVQTGHGNVAEAEFRKWLTNFLPKRYGVTSGFIISAGTPDSENIVHYDVIIYDQLESPVLWIDANPDCNDQGRSLAIPVEYVKGVIEVKSAFNKKSVKKAVQQLEKLKPLLAKIDPVGHPLKFYLPANFFCATVFFELREKDDKDFAALDELLEAASLRGYYGGFILRSETLDQYYSGKLSFLKENSEIEPNNESLSFWASSKSKRLGNNFYRIHLTHFESYFSEFAFDIIAMLKGSYHPSVLSSLYGMGSTQWEKGSAVDIRYSNPDDFKRYKEETEKYFPKFI